MKAILIGLSAAVALAAGSSAAMAAKKHHGKGPGMDPRAEYAMHRKGGWCDIDPNCNGWNKYLAGTPKDHKKYAPTQIVIGKV